MIYTITGATGLVGSHLVNRILDADVTLRVLYRKGSNLQRLRRILQYYQAEVDSLWQKIDFREVDFADISALEKALYGTDYLFHCAATVSFNPRDRAKLRYENPRLTTDIVNLALHCKVQKLIYVSSVAALGRKPGQHDFDEKSHWVESHHNSDYAKGKYAAELEVWRASEEGLPVAIVNPTIILGPGHWKRGSSALFHRLAQGFKYYTQGVNGFVDVRDVAEVMWQLSQSEISGERYVLCAENWSYRDLFWAIAQKLERAKPSVAVKPWMAQLAWRWEALKTFLTGKSPLITRSTAQTAQQVYRYHSEKVKRDLDFNFRPLEQSLNEICAQYRSDFD